MDERRLTEIEAKHRDACSMTDYGSGRVLDFCTGCGNATPCDTSLLIAEMRRLRDPAQRLTALAPEQEWDGLMACRACDGQEGPDGFVHASDCRWQALVAALTGDLAAALAEAKPDA